MFTNFEIKIIKDDIKDTNQIFTKFISHFKAWIYDIKES